MPAAPGLLALPPAASTAAPPARCCADPDPAPVAVVVTLPAAVRDRVVLLTAGRAASATCPRLLLPRLKSGLPPNPPPPPPDPTPPAPVPTAPPLRVRVGESAAAAARASALGSWLPLLRSDDPPPPLGSLLDLAIPAVVAAVLGDNDPPGPPPPPGGLKPNRLTPGADGGFTLVGVKGALFACLPVEAADDAACGGGGSPPLLVAVKGDRAFSGLVLAGAQSYWSPEGGPLVPTDSRPSHSFSLSSSEARRGLIRLPPCRDSYMGGDG